MTNKNTMSNYNSRRQTNYQYSLLSPNIKHMFAHLKEWQNLRTGEREVNYYFHNELEIKYRLFEN